LKNCLGGGYKLSKILIGVSILVIIGTVFIGKISHAGFKSSISVPLAKGKITYKKPDLHVIAMYIQNDSSSYDETTIMPDAVSYIINEDKSYCNVNGVKDNNSVLKTINGVHSIAKLQKGSNCFLYFDQKKGSNVNNILEKYIKNDSRKGIIEAAFTENTPTTVYSKRDSDGISYAFAGVNPNNWVKLGNLYFRIIRFNGDGSLRLIYSGEGFAEINGADTQIGKKSFNLSCSGNHCLGLKYSSGSAHGTSTNSTILGKIDSTDGLTLYGWYNSKIKPNYESLIDTNAGFCSDRRSYLYSGGGTVGGGTGNTNSYYRAYVTYYKSSSPTSFNPDLTCPTSGDKLTIPVGLITLDEYMLAGGGTYSSDGAYDSNFWLYTGEQYWTMTPSDFSSGYANLFTSSTNGRFNDSSVTSEFGVRPVINLKASTVFEVGGTGTSENPYVVKI